MKNLRVSAIILIITLAATSLYAQSVQRSNLVSDEIVEFETLMHRLQSHLDEIPFNMNRIAFYNFDIDEDTFTKSGRDYLRTRIKSEFVSHSTTGIVSVPEFESLGRLNVIGTDSTLIISSSTFTTPDETASKLLELGQKYSLDGYLEGTLQYRSREGYLLNIRLTRPSSREVVWSKNITSRNFLPEEDHDKGSLVLINIGTGLLNTNQYTFGGDSYSDDLLALDYSFALTIRQPVNHNNGGYVGLVLGAHYFNLTNLNDAVEIEGMNVFYGQVGFVLTKTLFEKNHSQTDHWVDFNLGANMYIRSESNNVFTINQSVNFNLSRNIGLSLNFNYLLGDNPSLKLEEESKQMHIKNMTYGFGILFRL